MAEETLEELLEEYYEGSASDSMSEAQFLISKGRRDLIAGKGRDETIKIGGNKAGGRVKAYKKGGLARKKRSIARGCGAVMGGRRKKTLYI